MVLKPNKRHNVLDEFRAERGQSTEAPKPTPRPKRKGSPTPYDVFRNKLEHFDSQVGSFTTQDLLYYFREVAEENGFKYVITNIKKDLAIMKRLRENYTNWEICAMIEFLYQSDQDYLEKDRLSPNLLASGWVNTIYSDTLLWVDDKYKTQSSKTTSKRLKSQHEWDSQDTSGSEIGVKL